MTSPKPLRLWPGLALVALMAAPWLERLAAFVVIVLAVIVTKPLMHPSITGAAMGYFFYILSIPSAAVAIVAALWLTRGRDARARRIAGAAAILMACADSVCSRRRAMR
jgi:hypothetical protein